ncbi:hypothetical protein ACFCX0_48335 [Streptomyces sp. NPDC056352]|uniref:hypothetical protein n=1 Tax=Streptomyces sp. NPDC056352 TaxID=3345791 RepID=UPI0035D6299F
MAHPLHATALTIHAITGADISRLALIRGIDIDETATTVKIHDSTAHRRCRLYPLPTWTRRLVRAASIHGQLKDRAPDSPRFPLITVQDGEQLRLTATGTLQPEARTVENDTTAPASTLSTQPPATTAMTSNNTHRAVPTGNQLTRRDAKNVSAKSASVSPPETPTTAR